MHIERLPSGSYRASVSIDGRRHRATGPTKSAAKAALYERVGVSGLGPQSVGTVDDLLDVYLPIAKVGGGTLDDYRAVTARLRGSKVAAARKVLALPVSDIEPRTLTGLYRALEADGWTTHRVIKLGDVFAGAFKHAVVELGWARTNPTPGTAPRRPARSEPVVPSHDDVRAVIAGALSLDDPPPAGSIGKTRVPGVGRVLALAIRIAATIGDRRGETVALQWSDIDVDAGTITVRRSLTYSVSKGLVVGDTKTHEKGHRVVTIRSRRLLDELRQHRTRQRKEALAHGLAPPVWVCSDDAGASPWRPDRFTSLFADARKAAGVDVMLKNLRHYTATTLLSEGVPVSVVAGILGHTTASTTLRLYWRHVPGVDAAAADIMASKLG